MNNETTETVAFEINDDSSEKTKNINDMNIEDIMDDI